MFVSEKQRQYIQSLIHLTCDVCSFVLLNTTKKKNNNFPKQRWTLNLLVFIYTIHPLKKVYIPLNLCPTCRSSWYTKLVKLVSIWVISKREKKVRKKRKNRKSSRESLCSDRAKGYCHLCANEYRVERKEKQPTFWRLQLHKRNGWTVILAKILLVYRFAPLMVVFFVCKW